MASIGDAAHPVAKFINDADPGHVRVWHLGTGEPATTPAGWLPWLGWLIGVPVTDMDTTNAAGICPGQAPRPTGRRRDPGRRAGHTDRQPLLPGHHGPSAVTRGD